MSKKDDDPINVKPSPELIPDEYAHIADSVLVHVFCNESYKEVPSELIETFQKLGYDLSLDKNVHVINSNNRVLQKDLATVKGETKGKKGLIVIFIASLEGDDVFFVSDDSGARIQTKEIWNQFTANNCPDLDGQPKIFIFCSIAKPTRVRAAQVDGIQRLPISDDIAYGLPAEADMMVVYVANEDDHRAKNSFLANLCRDLGDFGKKDSLYDLIIRAELEQPPIVISTLTKKFYVSASEQRHHYLVIEDNHSDLKESVARIKDQIKETNQPPPRVQVDGARASGRRKKSCDTTSNRPPWR